MTETIMARQSDESKDIGYFWSRVQYCPDSTRGDLFTVGVALFDASRRKFLPRHVGKSAILNRMLASAGYAQLSTGELESLCSPAERLLKKFAGDDWTIESLGKATSYIGLQTKICFSSPLGVSVEDPTRLDLTLEDIFRGTIGEAMGHVDLKKRRSSKAVAKIITAIRRLNPTAAKNGLVTTPHVTMPSYGDKKLAASFMYRNGAIRLNQVIDLKEGDEEREISVKSSQLIGNATLVARHPVIADTLTEPTQAVLDLIFAKPLPCGAIFKRFEDDFRDMFSESKFVVASEKELAIIAASMKPTVQPQ